MAAGKRTGSSLSVAIGRHSDDVPPEPNPSEENDTGLILRRLGQPERRWGQLVDEKDRNRR
jgi:hypothetical protein